MGNAEEGGLGSQRVLLIGGPKHADFVNLAEGQTEYEFTSMKSLLPYDAHSKQDGWNNWPSTATHLYKLDNELSMVLYRGSQRPCNLFTHESLWNTPYQGGFNLHALREALRACETAKADLQAADERLQAKQQIVSDRNREISEFQEKYEKLLELSDNLAHQLLDVRILLEGVGVGVAQAIRATGCDYPTVLQPRDG